MTETTKEAKQSTPRKKGAPRKKTAVKAKSTATIKPTVSATAKKDSEIPARHTFGELKKLMVAAEKRVSR